MSFFKTGGNVCDFLFSSLYEEAIPKCCILFKEKICSLSKYLPLTPLRRDIYEKEQVGGGGGERGGGNEHDRVASHESVPIHIKSTNWTICMPSSGWQKYILQLLFNYLFFFCTS